MNKLKLIIQREYLTRVKTRSFILSTLLVPIGTVLFSLIVVFMMSYQSDDAVNIAVLDRGDILEHFEQETLGNITLTRASQDLVTLKQNMESLKYDGILEIPALGTAYDKKLTVFYYSEDKPSLGIQERTRSWLKDHITTYKTQRLELDSVKLAALKTRVSIDPRPVDEAQEDTSSSMSSIIAAMIATIMTMIMIMIIAVYGSQVMQGVMEEKTNRIVEIVISSVRPFELMMGKIIGIGLVGLTQLAIWAILLPFGAFIASLFMGGSATDIATANIPESSEANMGEIMETIQPMLVEVMNMNWGLMIPVFLIFFLAGYFMYASLFAAIGSAMDDNVSQNQMQTFTLPITLPVILASYITFFVVIREPDSSLSFWASIFPLFSPLVMPARMAFDPPIWQVLLSLVLLLATCVSLVWLAGRIYRIGILMYGKKYNVGQMFKWIFYRD